MPLRKLALAATRREIEHYLIDCVVALERLLVTDKHQNEIMMKFSFRGAALLSDEFGNIQERLDLMKKLYKDRSSIIHGSLKSNNLKTEDIEKAENVLREILLWYIKKGIYKGTQENIMSELDLAFIEGGTRLR
jgi:Apea-like HEPN